MGVATSDRVSTPARHEVGTSWDQAGAFLLCAVLVNVIALAACLLALALRG